MVRNRIHKEKISTPAFSDWLNDRFPGTIMYHMQENDGATVAKAYNQGVAGLADSALFPGASVIINPSFVTDTDWTKGDAAITIAGGKATWSGAQAGNADLTAAVNPLTNGVRYGQRIVLSGVSAGTVTPIFGTQAGTALSANGTYDQDEAVANGAPFLLRGDSAFAGSCELVKIRTANPLNAPITGATVAQRFGGNIPLAYSFDGNNDFVNIYSSALNSVFDGGEDTLIAFAQVANAGVWVDATVRNIISLQVDGNNFILIRKSNVSNRLEMLYEANNIRETITKIMSLTAPFMVAMTNSKSTGTGESIGYINGQQVDTKTNLGLWAGSLASNLCTIGAVNITPQSLWSEKIAEVIIHPARAMTPIEIAEIYQRSGI